MSTALPPLLGGSLSLGRIKLYYEGTVATHWFLLNGLNDQIFSQMYFSFSSAKLAEKGADNYFHNNYGSVSS
jgi:hypothetical protein